MTVGAPVTEHRLRAADGARLRYIAAGTGRPVVVSSPIGLHLDFWRPLFAAMRGAPFRFLALQSRGLWGSAPSPTPQGDTLAAHAGDIAALIGQERLTDYDVLGYCGGTAPLVAALEQVGSAPRRALLVSTLFRRARQEQIVQRILDKFEATSRPGAYRMILSAAFQLGVPQFQALAEQEICTPERLPAYLRQLRSLYAYEFPCRINVSGDVHIAVMSGDIPSIIESSLWFSGRMLCTTCRVASVPEADHFFMYNNAQRARMLLIDVLGKNAGVDP
jgi:hypothetical protein